MEKQDLINAIRIISDYCDGVNSCSDCLIRQECRSDMFWHGQPNEWFIGELDAN